MGKRKARRKPSLSDRIESESTAERIGSAAASAPWNRTPGGFLKATEIEKQLSIYELGLLITWGHILLARRGRPSTTPT